jgi:hypothetical protein
MAPNKRRKQVAKLQADWRRKRRMNIRQYLAKIGRKGGKATSEAKAKAARLNAQKPRPRKRAERKG